jgi:kumamolisin
VPGIFGSLRPRRDVRGQRQVGGQAGVLTPRDLARMYGLEPFYASGICGQGTTIAFLEFAPPSAADDARFWRQHSLAPERNTPVATVSLPGAQPDPGALDETDLDLEYAGALAPGARLVTYLLSDQTDAAGFLGQVYDALAWIAADGVRIVSISLGTGERQFAAAARIEAPAAGRGWRDPLSYAADLDALVDRAGLLVFAAAGDSGAYGGAPFGDPVPQPVWPAVQPSFLAVGGTQLARPGDPWSGEEAWGGQTGDPAAPGYNPANTLGQASGGGGCSRLFPPSPAQAALGLTGRGTPDVAAFAGPLLVTDRGRDIPVWGTSAAAPIAAAMAALATEAHGRLPARSAIVAAARDVVRGNNWNDALMAEGLTTFYAAAPGLDLCTGAGRVAPV